MNKLSLIEEMDIAELNRRAGGYEVSHVIFDNGGTGATFNKMAEIIANKVLRDKAVSNKLYDGSGNEAQKTLLRNKATKTVGNKARACGTYFHSVDLLAIEARMNRKKNFYDKKKQEEIVGILQGVRDELYTYRADLETPFGVNTGWFTLVDGQIADLDAEIPVIGDTHEAVEAAGDDVLKYIGLEQKMYDQLDPIIIDAYEEAYPDEVAAYLKTRGQDTVGKHHNNVACSMLLKPALEGINRGLIIITDTVTGLELKRVYMDAHGLGEFIMRTGEYYATASFQGCDSIRVIFKPEFRGTIHLDFLMNLTPTTTV